MRTRRINKVAILLSGFLVFVVLCTAAYFLFAPDAIRYRSEINRGNELVVAIQEFRQRHGHLPDSVEALRVGHRDSQGLFYERCAEDHFIVWFGTTLGESMTYDSGKRTWESMNGPCADR